jgi:hypothetical protein
MSTRTWESHNSNHQIPHPTFHLFYSLILISFIGNYIKIYSASRRDEEPSKGPSGDLGHIGTITSHPGQTP